jgi:RHS repeat-associated protein
VPEFACHRRDRRRRSLVALAVLGSACAVLAASPPRSPAADVLSGAEGSTLVREPQVTPQELGDGALDGLQYADPLEALDLVEPPAANNQGNAELSHPLSIPAGRGGVAPELSIDYDSGGGNGWLGTGWDLSVGEITIDTRWGVPRYDAGKESETYLLDGDVLSPTAVRSNLQDRVAERSDFTRRIEMDYERIVRHGSSPKTYWWEVTDKSGNVRWYGGFPDGGGPIGDPGGTRDPSAILSDANGNAYRWALSAQRDVGVNTIRYFYDTVEGKRVGAEKVAAGKQLYLKRILYTGASPASGEPDDPAYEVRLLRDGDVSPAPAARKDVVVNARGGFLEVTSDLLRRVEVRYGAPTSDGSPRTHNIFARRFDLEYEEGAFGKTLLKSVAQVGSDGVAFGRHTFDYYDDVRDADGNYDGFAASGEWNTGDDGLEQTLLGKVEISSLGASQTNGADGHAYIGFNPGVLPSKTGSFGGAIAIKGGATEALAEMFDIDGDLLPDKVFRDVNNGPVRYRLNTSGPRGGHTFGVKRTVGNLDKLSNEFDIGVGGGPEAYFGASVQFNIAANFSVGEAYFTDVNNDGLPDFVTAGNVRFNHLEDVGGVPVPSFTNDSADTSVPIDDGSVNLPAIQEIADLEARQREMSPLQDVVRRWVAPFSGTVTIDGAVTLDPPPDTRKPPPPYDGDGVRVAIQRGGAELWASSLSAPGQAATPAGVGSVNVTRDQAIYFRVQSVDDGARDQVRWDPRVRYTSYSDTPAAPQLDVNGLSQAAFDAADDFTLAGRADSKVIMPLDGTVRFEALLRKTAVTTDDVTVLVSRNGAEVVKQTISAQTVSADGIPVSAEFPVSGPGTFGPDEITVRLAVDSPIDVTALEWAPRLYYLSAVSGGEPVVVEQNGVHTLELLIPADIDIYPRNTLTAPATPWTSDLGRTVTVHAELAAAGDSGGGDVVLTVKQRNKLVAKRLFKVPDSGVITSGAGDVDVTLASGEDYWYDLSIRSPGLSDKVISSNVELRWDDGGAQTRSVPHVRNWTGRQGYFPAAYRGWAFAGYKGDGARAAQPIDEDAFVFDQSDFPTSEPTGFNDGSYPDPAQGDAFAFTPHHLDLLDADENVVDTVPVWRGIKDNLVGGAGFVRSSRNGVDSPAMAGQAGSVGAGARGVRRFGITAPAFSLTAGIGPVSASFGASPSFGLLDYTDLNGDAFPDVVAPGYVQYTGARGGYVDSGDGVTIVGQDFTFAVGGGFSGSAVELKANSKGDANTAQDTAPVSGSAQKPTSGGAASQGESASGDQFGASIGGSLGITANFTNPITSNPDWDDAIGKLPAGPGALEEELADVNGDGLPDKVAVDANGVRVRLNLGYRFSADSIRWSSGGFESGEAYSGSVGPTLGFQYNFKEFAGGLSYSESIDFARYSWADVDGDGVLDRLRKDGSGIKVAFGTGAGLQPEVDYGDLAEGVFDLIGDIPTGQQVAQGRSRGLGVGADFTVGIGPLCLVGCWIMVNPGVHVDHSVSTTQIQLSDINGDGYPDSLFSNADNQLKVRLNNRGRTNLLRSVTNPIGGQIGLGYERDGNTTQQPYPKWLMSRVEVDDNRAGDGPDTLLSTYEYSGNAFNSLEREFLGYDKVVERQRAFADDSDPSDDPLLRSVDRRYRNATVFDGGLVTSETLRDPSGTPIKETRSTWSLVDLATGAPADLDPSAADPAGLRFLRMAVGPVRTKVEQRYYDAAGDLGQNTWNEFDYDELGNVVRQVDVGEPERATDDLVARTTYSECVTSSSDVLKAAHPCPAPTPAGTPVSPLADPTRCSTWVSLPATFEVRDHAGKLLRSRDGHPALCDNSTVTRLEERAGDGDVAVTELSYNPYGSYNHIEYPENADGDRYTVDYLYDDNSDTNVSEVTDSHGLTASASFDGPTGRIASRTDPNGQTTSYDYDVAGRLASITGAYEQGGGDPTVRFEYRPSAPAYAHAIARNRDAFHPGQTIDTVAFVDGMGRETQTKQDATVFRGAGIAAEDVMVVAGAVEFDALGRPVKEWYPIEEPLGTIGTYNTSTATVLPTVTTYALNDRETKIEAPGNRVTTMTYGFGGQADFGATLFTTTVADAEGKPQRSYTDVRDSVAAVDDLPAGAPRMRTRYVHDPLGQLTGVVDKGGNATTHTYDLLGRRTSTRTPDGGLLEKTWDLADNLVAEVDPNLREAGGEIGYRYDFDRLVAVDYSDATPDVEYEYGAAGAAGRGAGRIVGLEDGAREQRLAYDPLGAVAQEVTTMLVHNLNEETEERLTFTTEQTYDGFGRTRTLTYPDGQVLSHGYDSGGLLSSLSGDKGFHHYGYLDRLEYDEFLDRRFQLTGTAVKSEYTYDEQTRRLSRQATDTPDREIQDLNYTYDRVGNVLTKSNQLPPPVPELKGGPSTQNYRYDPYYRLRSADGRYLFAPDKQRDYTFSTTYDSNGNVTSKNQTDIVTVPGGSAVTQGPTTYNHKAIDYGSSKPHAVTRVGRRPYTQDRNGNFTGWTDDRTGQSRAVTWDAADRVRSVADQGSTTRFSYDDTGRLAIERGPSGETSFVNQWYTVRNGTVAYKQIWAGQDRLAVQRAFDDGSYEHMRYFMHKDLQGSTNVVTDDTGLAFEWLEYFPSGETWVLEHSDIHRTPHLFGGAYHDEVRGLINMGARWYEPREQFMYSPDPILQEEPDAAVDDPALLPAYSYAESNPLNLVDLEGRAPSRIRAAFSNAFVQAAAANAVQVVARGAAARSRGIGAPSGAAAPAPKARSSRLWAALESFSQSDRAKKWAAFADRFEAKPLIQINLAKTAKGWALKDVKVSPTFFLKQFTVKTGAAGKPPAAASPAGSGAVPPGVAAADSGPASQPSAVPSAGPSGAPVADAGPSVPNAPPGQAQQSSPPPSSSSP